jgi:hypothetical protein
MLKRITWSYILASNSHAVYELLAQNHDSHSLRRVSSVPIPFNKKLRCFPKSHRFLWMSLQDNAMSLFLLRLSFYSFTSTGPLLFPQRPSVTSTALCHLYGPLSPQWPSAPSIALCPFYRPLSPLQPLSTLWPSVPSKVLFPLYGPLSRL